MTNEQRKCLKALGGLTIPNGEQCVPFKPLQRRTGYGRAAVRRYVRALARKGLAEYFRALCNDSGEFCGAGYCITEAGREALHAQKR